MTTYAWPGYGVRRFSLHLLPNLRPFVGPYTPATQVLDLLGERWTAIVEIAASNNARQIAGLEAYFDRLKGAANLISMSHLRLTAPQGTMRDGLAGVVRNASSALVPVVNASSAAVTVIYGQPVLTASVAQLANTAPLLAVPGSTLYAGDMLGINGQLIRVMSDVTFDGSGKATVEFQGRARTAWTYGTAVLWDAPKANFMLKSPDGVPTVWLPGGITDAISFELIEVF
jgi:hypothetical protein